MKLALIAAVSRNRVIGKDGKLPWHLPEDLKRFKRLTTGHTVLMGRKTFESLGKSLPNRRTIVLTSHPIRGVETFTSIPEALKALRNEEKVFVIGGGEIFSQLLDRADLLHLTIIDRVLDGDTYFPPYEHLVGSRFKETSREDHDGFAFVDFVKVG